MEAVPNLVTANSSITSGKVVRLQKSHTVSLKKLMNVLFY